VSGTTDERGEGFNEVDAEAAPGRCALSGEEVVGDYVFNGPLRGAARGWTAQMNPVAVLAGVAMDHHRPDGRRVEQMFEQLRQVPVQRPRGNAAVDHHHAANETPGGIGLAIVMVVDELTMAGNAAGRCGLFEDTKRAGPIRRRGHRSLRLLPFQIRCAGSQHQSRCRGLQGIAKSCSGGRPQKA